MFEFDRKDNSMKYVIAGIALSLWGAVAGAETLRVDDLERAAEVQVFGDVEVEISQGEKRELLIRGPQPQLDRQPFFLRGDTLVLGTSRRYPDDSFSDVKYKLTLPDMREVRLAGSGEVFVKPFSAARLDLRVDGSGNIRLFSLRAGEVGLYVSGSGDIQVAELESEALEMLVSGSGDIALGNLASDRIEATITGSGDISAKDSHRKAGTIELRIIGGGAVDLAAVDSESVEIQVVGSGDARVGEVLNLEVAIIGSGDIYYAGDPDIDSAIVGSGDLSRRD